jgi:ribonuclease HII
VQREPDLACERRAWEQGHRLMVGIDEAGRGAWAGPVVAAAVILPAPQDDLLVRLGEVRDSKLLSPAQREHCYETICEVAVALGVGSVDATGIDRLGILPATRAAMMQAVAALNLDPDYYLVDAVHLHVAAPQRNLIKGDRLCLSIAAASIIAKVTRDRWMVAYDADWPLFGLARHKGYGTPEHRRALHAFGPTPLHRYSYEPVRQVAEGNHA